MSAGANFFLCSCAILTFTIINLNVGPIVNGLVGSKWPSTNCKIISDEIDEMEKNPNITKEEIEKEEVALRECRNKRAMHDMEYTSFIFNAAIGFICTLLGLFGLQKEIIKKTGMVGAGLGVIGFVLTLVYVIYNGVVYTNYYNKSIFKRDGDGAVAELISSLEFKYRCLFFNKVNDTDALYAKYNDIIKSQYNYNRALIDSFNKISKSIYLYWILSLIIFFFIYVLNFLIIIHYYIKGYHKRTSYLEVFYELNENVLKILISNCEDLFKKVKLSELKADDDSNYDISARFLTVLIFSIFIILCHLGLICSGLLLMKEA